MLRGLGIVDPTLQDGITALPACYSWELDECITPSDVAPPELAPFPRCDEVRRAYAANADAMQTAEANWPMLGAAGVLSLALGFFIGRLAS